MVDIDTLLSDVDSFLKETGEGKKKSLGIRPTR